MTRSNMFKLLLLLCLCLFSIGLNQIACQERRRNPKRFLIPDGYVGWMRVNYEIHDALSLPVEDGFYLLEFPSDGVLNTSTKVEEGWARDEYYYLSDKRRGLSNDSENRMIWGHIAFGSRNVPGSQPTTYEEFFVGTKQEYQQYGLKNKDKDLNPIIGPMKWRKTTYEASPRAANEM